MSLNEEVLNNGTISWTKSRTLKLSCACILDLTAERKSRSCCFCCARSARFKPNPAAPWDRLTPFGHWSAEFEAEPWSLSQSCFLADSEPMSAVAAGCGSWQLVHLLPCIYSFPHMSSCDVGVAQALGLVLLSPHRESQQLSAVDFCHLWNEAVWLKLRQLGPWMLSLCEESALLHL